MSDLLFETQELVLCAFRIECDKKGECELVKKARDISDYVVELLKLQREMARTRPRLA